MAKNNQFPPIPDYSQIITSPCVRSGYCCKQAPCQFGIWDEKLHQCQFLEKDDNNRYLCGIYDEIIKDPEADYNPAFGAGCCSPMNSDRLAILKQNRP